jgi:hypothetical protein
MEGKLLLKGSFEQLSMLRTYIPGKERAFHNSNWGLVWNIARFESLYTMAQQGDLTIKVQSIVRYYYEAITDLDREMHNALPAGIRREYQTPSYFHDDPLNEFYFDIIKGSWNVRVGKQLVSWGETALRRTTDLVNPTDQRYSTSGITPFEDLKIGLWMLRTYYQSPLPGNLLFETIFVPGDFQLLRLSVPGTNWGKGKIGSPIPDNRMHMMQSTWKEEAPRRLRSISNYQWGMRVRGQIGVVDWSLQYLDWIDWLPMGHPIRANQQVIAFMTSGGTLDHSIVHDPWLYKRSKHVGANFQWFDEKFFRGVIRGEVAYHIGQHFNTTNVEGKMLHIPAFKFNGTVQGPYDLDQKTLLTGIKEKDVFAYALAFDRRVAWPWLMQYNKGRTFACNVQIFQDWILQHERALDTQRGKGDRNSTALSLMLQFDWFDMTVMTTYTGYYDTTGTGYNCLDLFYGADDHWRFSVGSMFFYSFVSWKKEPAQFDKDCFYFKVKYEW